ncbi:MAG: multicopper oxidase domain-containing protein [Candidatus Acidiferrales bacterium]
MHTTKLFSVIAILFGVLVQLNAGQPATPKPADGKVRTYYVAADEVVWNYAPDGIDHMTGKPFEGFAKVHTESGPHRIGTKYLKAVYREYTDDTFQTLKPRSAQDQYLGTVGPVLHAEVGDTIKVVFKNNGSHPFSMHPHGVAYDKSSEGVAYAGMPWEETGVVAPGKTHTYIWEVLDRSGPRPNDPSSVVWLYHSHVHEIKDVNAGLIGAIVITRRGMAREDGTPKDVDHEFVSLFMAYNESQSWYLDHNIETYTSDPKGVKTNDIEPLDDQGHFMLTGHGFGDTTIKWSINGYIYGNMPMMTMKRGEHVRWYVVTIGDGFNFHTPHWHGNVVTTGGETTDVVAISPAQMITADMVPDKVGTWLFHCHVSDHMAAGMLTFYQVLP